MSRCFPFPPPGYVSKPDDVKLVIKEKKQKKHKDKKDKDKKEKKDKEKERSEGKTKDDKKRKREKHKDKEKKKDKVSSLEEKKVVGSSENQNVEKLVPDNRPIDRIEDKRTFSELGDRVRNNGASDNKKVRKITFVEKSKVNFPENCNGRMANGHSVKVDAKNLGNGLVENCYEENNNMVKGGKMERVEKRKEGKERNGYKKRIGEREGSEKEERNKNVNSEDKRRKEEEKKEKAIVTDFDANNPLDLVKEDLNVFSHENGIPSNNLLCHQAGQVLPYKLLLSDQAGKRNGFLPNNISRFSPGQNGVGFSPPQSIKNLTVEKKDVRTNQKTNGKLCSPQSVIKNARKSVTEFNNDSSHLVHIKRKVDLCQTTNGEKAAILEKNTNGEKVAILENEGIMIMEGSDVAHITNSEKNPLSENGGKMIMQEADTVKKTNNKELRMNGTTLKVKEKIDASMKPPHPDLKFLGEILSIPRVECAQYDDQEWLFGCKDSQLKRPNLASPLDIVWAEAMMPALPYVIPY